MLGVPDGRVKHEGGDTQLRWSPGGSVSGAGAWRLVPPHLRSLFFLLDCSGVGRSDRIKFGRPPARSTVAPFFLPRPRLDFCLHSARRLALVTIRLKVTRAAGDYAMDEPSIALAQRYLALDEDDLYALLATPQGEQPDLFSREGRIAKGKRVFVAQLGKLRNDICGSYRAHSQRVDTALDIVAIVTPVLLAATSLSKELVYPLAALITKLGIDEICREVPDEDTRQ
jgi:hypothetical protein